MSYEYDKRYFVYTCGVLRFRSDAPDGKIPQPKGISDYSYMFSGIISRYDTYDLSDWDMSGAKSLKRMFMGTKARFIGLDNWDVSNVEDMSETFSMSELGDNCDISHWDVSSVKSM